MRYDPDRACPKCAALNAATEYDGKMGCNIIRRRCGRCGYTWIEEPLDSPSENAAHGGRNQKEG